MWNYVRQLLASDFMPHGYCYRWQPEILWTHVLSDAGIALAYFSIPVALLVFVRRRQDMVFHWVFVLFATFIFACGLTHLLEIWSVWHGTYRFTGAMKFGTAIASLSTAVVLWPLLPKALAIPSLTQLEQVNHDLQRQIIERQRAEEALARQAEELERRVVERTMALEAANQQLLQEVRERNKAEERFRLAVDSAPNAMVMINVSGRIVLINSQTEQVFGYSASDLIDQPIEILVPEPLRQQHETYRTDFMAVPAARKMGTGRDLYGVRKDGTTFPVEIGLMPITTGEGFFVLSAIIDITERKQAEQVQREHEEQLRQSNADLDAFVHIASHDLKEPLRGIHNLAQILLEDCADKLSEESQEDLHTLGRLAQRMEGLIDDLRLYSRIGRAEEGTVSIDMNELVADVCDHLHALLDERGVTVHLSHTLPRVSYHRAYLFTIMQNLIANAARYNDKPEKWIEIGVQAGELAPVFYVRDNGIGIVPELQEQVFLMFRRLHRREQYGSGSGAGLAIVRRILERHDGRIWLASQPGQGTTFYFTLGTVT